MSETHTRTCHPWILHIPGPQICTMKEVVWVVPLCYNLIFPVPLHLSPCQVMHGIHLRLSQSCLTPTILLQQLKYLNTYPAHQMSWKQNKIRACHAQHGYVSAAHRFGESPSYTLDIRRVDHQNVHARVVRDHVSERMRASIASKQMGGFSVA